MAHTQEKRTAEQIEQDEQVAKFKRYCLRISGKQPTEVNLHRTHLTAVYQAGSVDKDKFRHRVTQVGEINGVLHARLAYVDFDNKAMTFGELQ